MASAVLAVVLLTPLVIAAVRADGFHETKVDLNDAGVWVVNTGGGLLGRLNTQISLIEVSLAADSTGPFDIAQADSDVLLALPPAATAPASIRAIDVATGTIGDAREVPTGAEVQMGGPTAALLDPGSGNVWVAPRAELTAVDPSKEAPDARGGPGAVMAVGLDGVSHVYSPDDRVVRSIVPSDGVEEREVGGEVGAPAITAVGSEVVLLDRDRSTVVLPDGDEVSLEGFGEAPELQLPGPAGGAVLVATSTSLLSIPLGGGDPEVLDDSGTGGPARPVQLGSCAYGAWSGAPRVAQLCDGRDPILVDYPEMPAGNPLRFRVNRNRVVLNETTTGYNVLFTDEDPVAVEDWSQAEDNEDDINEPEVTPEDQPECTPEVDAPELTADSVGTRAGRPVVVDVLANDQVDPCDVALVEIAQPPNAADATAAVVEDGAAVQVVPAPEAAGPIRLTYGLRSGAGDLVEEEIEVTIHDDAVNSAPTAAPDETTTSVGRTARHNVLSNDTDPEGDALTLVSATPVQGGAGGTVNFRADGEITFRASGTAGATDIEYVAQDERGLVAEVGKLTVQVLSQDNTPPLARDDRVVAQVGEELTVDVLENDDDDDGDELRLSGIAEVPPNVAVSSWEPDGRVTLVASAVGSGIFSYAVDDGIESAEGRVRVTVEEAQGNRAPTAVRDDVVARPGIPAVIDLVANDLDRDGDVLAALRLEPEPDAPIAVELVDLHIARVTAAPGFNSTVAVRYTASDGVAESPGVLVVRPYQDLGVDQPPLLAPDDVALRGGTATRIPVLDNDVDPEGDQLELVDQDLQPFATDLPVEDGRLFVYGGELRYEAPRTVDARRTVRASYSVTDPAGNVQSADVIIDLAPNDPADNAAPTPPKLFARVYAGEEVAVPAPLVGLDPEGDPVAIVGVDEPPEKGLVSVVADGFVYRAFRGTSGPDRFTFTVADEHGGTAEGTVSLIVVPPLLENTPPIAVPDEVRVQVGQEVLVPVLLNDRDPEDDDLTVLSGEIDGPTTPSEGELRVDDGDANAFVFTAPNDISGAVDGAKELSFSYGITDGRGGRARGVVTITITEEPPDNLRPIAIDDFHTPVVAGESVTIDLLANDYDPDGDGGELVAEPSDVPGVTIAPDGTADVVVERSMIFRYQVTDRGGDGLPAWALVVIPVVDEAVPTCELQEAEVAAGESIDVPVLAGCTDPAGGDLRLVEVPRFRGGRAGLSGNEVRFEADPEVLGDAGFSFVVEADGERRAVGGVLVRVVGANFPPVLTTTEVQVSAGGTAEVDLLGLVTDENTEDEHTFRLSGGTTEQIDAAIEGSTLVVTASDDARGMTTALALQVSDGENEVEGVVPVQVLQHSKPPPVAVDDEIETNQAERVSVPVTDNDDDPLRKGLTARVLAPPDPSMGTATVSGDGRSIDFEPRSDFFGTASFVYSVTDQTGDPSRTSQATVRVSVIGYPSAPAAPTGEIASGLVDLRWGAPAANGSPITKYLIERRVEGGGGVDRIPTTTAGTTYRDTAVTNGTRYEYRVLAVNKAVDGGEDELNWSDWSAPLQPDQVPDRPKVPTLEFDDRKLLIRWEKPNVAGSEIEEYEVRVTGGFGPTNPRTVTAPATELEWPNLTNGTVYSVTVRARNRAEANGGWGEPSPAATMSPAGRPLAVTTFTAARLDENTAVGGAVQLNWSPPTQAQINAEKLERIELRWWRASAPGTTVGSTTATPQETAKKIYSLQNGEEYIFELALINKYSLQYDQPGETKTSNTVKPAARPNRMDAPGVDPGPELAGQTAVVNASLPADGGEPITRVEYQVVGGQYGAGSNWTAAPGVATGAAGTPVTFTIGPASGTPLTNGTSYQVRMRAGNEVADGDPGGLSGGVVPYGAPATPDVSASASGTAVTWQWSQPSLNGGSFLRYEFRVNAGGWSRSTGTSHSASFACGQTPSLEVYAITTGAAGDKPGGVGSASTPTEACRPTAVWTVGDAILGGTCAAGNTASAAWPNSAGCPSGQWIGNGTSLRLDCAVSSTSYTVEWADGTIETWSTWMRIQGGSWNGRWIKSAALAEITTDGAHGLLTC